MTPETGPDPDEKTPRAAPSPRDPLPARKGSQFLERTTYRRARLEDAARILPLLGVFLFFGPIMIQSSSTGFGGNTARWLMFFMAVWLLLIGLSALLSYVLRRGGRG